MTRRTAILALLLTVGAAAAASVLLSSSVLKGIILASTGAVSALLLIPVYGGEPAWNQLAARTRAVVFSR